MLYMKIKEEVEKLKGLIGVYYKNLATDDCFGINEQLAFLAASVIKIPVLIETYNQVENGEILLDETVKVSSEDKVPDCGAIFYMHDNLEVTLKDLCNLMIILSDNTAANILINRLNIHRINDTLKSYGLKKTRINRLLFDEKEQKLGKENYYSPQEMGEILEKLWRKEIISERASEEMLNILKLQQINHKIPYYLPAKVAVAHKTGEDVGVTHDVAIVYASKPYILCFASNDTDVTKTENVIRNISYMCYIHNKEKGSI